MQIPISEAIQQLRSDLREAILEGKDQDIVFTPNGIEIELGVNFATEAKAGGGFKLFAVLDLSAEGKVSRESQHKVKLSLSVADRSGNPLKVRSDAIPRDLPR
jgi:hypothetical protein